MKATILDYHLEKDIIAIDVDYAGREFSVTLDRKEFEFWLTKNHKLDYVENSGEPNERYGKMTLEQYYAGLYVEEDLVKFGLTFYQPRYAVPAISKVA